VETMEHLLCKCKHFSELLWERLTQLFNQISMDHVPRVELGQSNVIYNIQHPSFLIHIHDKTTRNTLLLLIQEMKRDIIYRRMNLPLSAQQITERCDNDILFSFYDLLKGMSSEI
jgi:hypothetical protein